MFRTKRSGLAAVAFIGTSISETLALLELSSTFNLTHNGSEVFQVASLGGEKALLLQECAGHASSKRCPGVVSLIAANTTGQNAKKTVYSKRYSKTPCMVGLDSTRSLICYVKSDSIDMYDQGACVIVEGRGSAVNMGQPVALETTHRGQLNRCWRCKWRTIGAAALPPSSNSSTPSSPSSAIMCATFLGTNEINCAALKVDGTSLSSGTFTKVGKTSTYHVVVTGLSESKAVVCFPTWGTTEAAPSISCSEVTVSGNSVTAGPEVDITKGSRRGSVSAVAGTRLSSSALMLCYVLEQGVQDFTTVCTRVTLSPLKAESTAVITKGKIIDDLQVAVLPDKTGDSKSYNAVVCFKWRSAGAVSDFKISCTDLRRGPSLCESGSDWHSTRSASSNSFLGLQSWSSSQVLVCHGATGKEEGCDVLTVSNKGRTSCTILGGITTSTTTTVVRVGSPVTANVTGYVTHDDKYCLGNSSQQEYIFDTETPRYKCINIGISRYPCYNSSSPDGPRWCGEICNSIKNCCGFNYKPFNGSMSTIRGRCTAMECGCTLFNDTTYANKPGTKWYRRVKGASSGASPLHPCTGVDYREVRRTVGFSGTCNEFMEFFKNTVNNTIGQQKWAQSELVPKFTSTTFAFRGPRGSGATVPTNSGSAGTATRGVISSDAEHSATASAILTSIVVSFVFKELLQLNA